MASTAPSDQWMPQLASFRDSSLYSDFEVVCRGRTWKVHRLVLGSHSEVFRHACDGELREPQDRRLDLSAHNVNVVESLISYMYTLDYFCDDDTTTQNAQLCVLADQYNIVPLKNLALQKCVTYMGYWGESFLSNKLNVVIQLVRMAYSGGEATQEMREAVCQRLVACKVPKDRRRLDKFRSTMQEYPDFAIDLLTCSAGDLQIEDDGLASDGDVSGLSSAEEEEGRAATEFSEQT